MGNQSHLSSSPCIISSNSQLKHHTYFPGIENRKYIMSLQNTPSTPPKRSLLVPHKRRLLPVTRSQTKTTLNPSAVPAGIQFRRPVFSSIGEEDEKNDFDAGRQSQKERVCVIEFDSSQAPQPFLEPDVLERMRERQRQRQREEEASAAGNQGSLGSQAGLDTEREIRRRALQTEYGSMAVRGRMAVSRRGRR